MSEQEKTAVMKRIFCAGFYTFCVPICLLLRVYRGKFPEIFPSFLIFFAAFAFGSYSGRISAKRYLHFIVLLIYSGLLLWFRDPLMFALVGGLSAGTFSADAFETQADKDKWIYAVRDYLSGSVCGMTFAFFGYIVPLLTILPALILYFLSVFCPKSENKRSGWAYASAFLIFLGGVFYAVNKYQPRPVVPEASDQTMEEQVPESLRDITIISMAHYPVEKVLLIQPEYSKHRNHKKKSEQDLRQNIIFYPDFVSVQERLASDKNHYDLIIITQVLPELDQYSREFVRLLKTHLRPHGVVVYLLPDDNVFRSGSLRAALQLDFKHIRSSGKLRLMAASDLPLKNGESMYISNILDSVLFTREWENQNAAEAAAVKVSTSSDYTFERKFLSCETSNPLLKAFYDHLPLKPSVFLITVSGLFLIYLITRYMAAYAGGMGFRLTVFFHSVLFFFVAGYLFFSRSLGGYPYGTWYCAALCPLLVSGIVGCYVHVKYYRWGLPILLVVGIISRVLMPHYGIVFIIGAWVRGLMIGFILPSIFQHAAGKYKTGTVEPAVLLESTSSGLFVAMLLLAMMP